VVLISECPGHPELPSGEVHAGEDYVLDTGLRVPLETAGFRRQRFHPLGGAGGHLLAWIEGEPYRGRRPHRQVPLLALTPMEAANALREAGRDDLAEVVVAAADSYRAQTEESYYADSLLLLEPAYLAAHTAEGQSGYGGTPEEWRLAREPIMDGIANDGTFLDVGCANGLLLESVQAWGAERGLVIEPYGVDLGSRLVERSSPKRRGDPGRAGLPGGRRIAVVGERPRRAIADRLDHRLTTNADGPPRAQRRKRRSSWSTGERTRQPTWSSRRSAQFEKASTSHPA
jgi:hypothetical protein